MEKDRKINVTITLDNIDNTRNKEKVIKKRKEVGESGKNHIYSMIVGFVDK